MRAEFQPLPILTAAQYSDRDPESRRVPCPECKAGACLVCRDKRGRQMEFTHLDRRLAAGVLAC